MEIPDPYLNIVKANYEGLEKREFDSDSLSRYFRGCFDETASYYHIYDAWACVECLRVGTRTMELGLKPQRCPRCSAPVFQIGTFQSRASRMGKAFEFAFMYLMSSHFGIELRHIGEKNKVFDFEYKDGVVIEAKGSPDYTVLPDGAHLRLKRAGMRRSDTKKKAFANAEDWKRRLTKGRFYIVTNANPSDLVEYQTDYVSGIYDITKKNQLDDFVRALTA